MTQKQQILNYMRQGNSITPLAALKLFGCFRLASAIFKIKCDGVDVRSYQYRKKDKQYSVYWLPNYEREMK